jgi:hypothetical protein
MRKHATCILVWEWMVAHEDALPQGYAIKRPTTDAQRAERLLRRQFNYLQSIKDEHPPALRALFEQIKRRTTYSANIATCNQVLEWLGKNEEKLPLQLKKPTTDPQRAERLLRRQYNYLKRETKTQPPVVRDLVEQIERRSVLGADTLICKNVLEWMDAHQNTLPKEYIENLLRKPSEPNTFSETNSSI